MSRHCTQCNLTVALGEIINPVCFGTTPHNLVDDLVVGYVGFTLNELRRELQPIREIIPIVVDISMENNNLWTYSKTAGKGIRDKSCRKSLKVLLGYERKQPVKCMVTGVVGNGNVVVCGHIVPSASEEQKIKRLGMKLTDLSNTSNLVFWVQGIEQCFEQLQLSFVQSNQLKDEYTLKIWDESIRKLPIFPGSLKVIEEFQGHSLISSPHHTIIKRGLSYQAYQAYLKNSTIDKLIALQCLSPGQYAYKTELDLLKE
eukprot:gene16120-21910_t